MLHAATVASPTSASWRLTESSGAGGCSGPETFGTDALFVASVLSHQTAEDSAEVANGMRELGRLSDVSIVVRSCAMTSTAGPGVLCSPGSSAFITDSVATI